MGILENVYTGSCERGYGTGRGGGGGLRWGYRILVRGAGMRKRSRWDKVFHLLNNPVSHGRGGGAVQSPEGCTGLTFV